MNDEIAVIYMVIVSGVYYGILGGVLGTVAGAVGTIVYKDWQGRRGI